MTRIGKQEERRARCPKKRHYNLQNKTGSKKDQLEKGYKEHSSAVSEDFRMSFFIPKIS